MHKLREKNQNVAVNSFCTYLNFDLIQWWTEIFVQLRVLPQILSQVLTNIQNV